MNTKSLAIFNNMMIGIEWSFFQNAIKSLFDNFVALVAKYHYVICVRTKRITFVCMDNDINIAMSVQNAIWK